MKAKDRFRETKIKLVMKLRGLTREAAIKALHLDGCPDEMDIVESKHSITQGNHLMAAKKSFGELDDGVELMTAEEFFGK